MFLSDIFGKQILYFLIDILEVNFFVFDQIFWKVNYIHFGQFCSRIVVQNVKLFLCYAEEYFICKVIKNGARRVYDNL